MKIYLAGGLGYPELLLSCGAKRVLSSWLENKSKYYKDFEIFLDSGAFSAETQGVKIDIQEYIKHIQNNIDHLDTYASLDVIGDDKGSYENFKIMKEAGLNPLPAFHQTEDFDYLRKYLESEDYVALGGLVGDSRSTLEPFLNKCFTVIKDYWPKKIHGFGITATWALTKYPFYSVDSTGWLGVRYGQVLEGEGYNVIDSKKRLFYLRKRTTEFILRKSIMTFIGLEETITRLWASKGVVWDNN